MKNLLLSYPRSGNTWLRYCIEAITGKSTIGYTNEEAASFDKKRILSFLPETDPILVKRHSPEDCDKLILLLRNYKEVIIRHHNEGVKPEGEEIFSHVPDYMNLIDFYDKFEKEKLIIYYIDFIEKPRETLVNILYFLKEEYSVEKFENFFASFESHKSNCINIYAAHGHSYTKGKETIFHSKSLSENDNIIWDNIVRGVNPIIFDKYLTRYVL